ncbi:MAG: hypothetical protein GEU28_00905 [Dehalococcoidia bacterium]|nr:hypothetical protein [Dehalococcoidia bacterium]
MQPHGGPVVSESPADLTVVEAAAAIRTRQLSPTELTEAVLARIETLDPEINAYITVLYDEAREMARAAQDEIAAGQDRGPFHGIPVGLKDLVDLQGVPTTGGTSFLRDNVAAEDGYLVGRLREAGAVFTGKLNMHEIAFGTDNVVSAYGPCRNPWATDRIPGGSSGGSGAAVAAGMCLAATGSDSGGSVRMPASLCGVVGFKPTYGLISTRGMIPLSWTLDHAGVLCRTVEDAAAMTTAIAGYDERDPWSQPSPSVDYAAGLAGGVAGLRVGIPANHFFDHASTEVAAAVNEAARVLAGLGADVREVSVDLSAADPYKPLAASLGFEQGTAGMLRLLIGSEAVAYHRRYLPQHHDDYQPQTTAKLDASAKFMAADYAAGQQARAELTRALERLLTDEADLLLAPATPVTAMPIAEIESGGTARSLVTNLNTAVFNLTGQPSISIPCGFDGDGLPIGLMLSGPRWSEETVLRAAHAYEQATEWHRRRPPPVADKG